MSSGYHAMAELTTVRRRLSARIARMSPERAQEVLAAIRARGVTIDQPAIREITGGYASQSLNAHVIRKLAARAGIIPKSAA